jgi:two-component system, sensor histidine kinase RegB
MAGLFTPAPGGLNLRRLLVLKNIAITGQTLAVIVVAHGLGMPLPVTEIISVLVLLNLASWLRLRLEWPVKEAELLIHLLVDVLALTTLLYFAGGATNPFVLLYLLPLTIAAATLPLLCTAAIAMVIVACYSVLMFVYIPLPHFHITYTGTFNPQAWGMWFGFVLSVALIAYFVVRMGNTLRENERAIAELKEAALRDERLVALGALAIGAAHEMSTPLGTMAIVAKDLQNDYSDRVELVERLEILRDQVDRCKNILTQMLSSTGQARAESGYTLALDSYLQDLLVQWRRMRPGAQLRCRLQGTEPIPQIVAEQGLSQAILNLLNNAADASDDDVELVGRWDAEELCIEIYDRGSGLSPQAEREAGKPFFTTKQPGQGMGLGLFLAQAALNRFGGAVQLRNREGGGACTQISLPLAKLLATA